MQLARLDPQPFVEILCLFQINVADLPAFQATTKVNYLELTNALEF